MRFLAPAGLAALVLVAPIVVLHMLTPRRPPTPVSSLLHWEGLRRSITAAEPWQRLRWSLLFLLQLLTAVLSAVALAHPATVEPAELAEHTVFVVDASGSMSSIDGSPDRLADAVFRARDLIGRLPDGGLASLVVASAEPVVLVEEEADPALFLRALQAIRTTTGPADWEATFALAESLVSADRSTGFVLISDGGLDEVAQRLAPPGTRYEAVGETDVNRAVTDLSVTAGPAGLQARVTVRSTGGPEATQLLRLDVDGVTAARREVTIPRGGIIEEVFELPLGSRVAVYLDGQDLVAYDNQRYAAAPRPSSLRARVHGDATFFVDQLLAAMPGVDTEVAPGEEVDFEVYVGSPVPSHPSIPFIAVDTPGGAPGITPNGRVEDPVPTLVAADPLLDDVDVSLIAIADAQLLSVEEGTVLIAAPGAPLVVRGDAGGVPFFYLAFTLERSNLPVNVAFPILGSRMIGELTSVQASTGQVTVGERILLGPDAVAVVDPRGTRQVVTAGAPGPVTDQSGFWTVERAEGETTVLAVNPDPEESKVAPLPRLSGLRPAPQPASGEATTTEVARSVLPWVVTALLGVLGIELVVARRSRGVSRKQWNWGMAVRALIAALLVATLFDPEVNTAEDSVTTVFVVDVSESMGVAVEQARSWVGAALAAAEEKDRWAIVEFGVDARVATPLGRIPYRAAREVDTTGTNPARALRLAESMLNGETRERIVLVSDGRANSGDLSAEIERLSALGVVVEVHTVAGEDRVDAAVAAVDLPSSVADGEVYRAEVEVLSTVAGSATVDLMVGGIVVESREVSLDEGVNRFGFEVTAGEPGVQRVSARVRLQGDAVRPNDLAESAVEVRGPASVLIVEGLPGEATLLGEALESKGLVVETTEVGSLPPLEALAAHRAVVLVDVSAHDMTSGQMETIDSFVRDLGRGLVVVGGNNAYALGGYRDTMLESLLPVDSEAQDPKRQATVAEVLLIDTSESMGACHCSESGEMSEGGVNKTDISKAAAVRAVEALTANDEVGVLAFAGSQRWILPLQQLPPRSVVDQGVATLSPFGETRIVPALRQAAEALRQSNKDLKHIILFTDGFTSELEIEGFSEGLPEESLVEAARALAAEGITVSVVGTGEGAIPALAEVAEAGGGRFYPGRDLNQIPEIFVQEARLAARSFINEGEFFPAVVSTSPVVRDLASSPALLGFVATTPKPNAEVQLQIGEFADPLLASWRVGLGKATAWTSDGGDRWGARWALWGGFADFWSNVVRDTFPLAGAEGQRVDASVADETMTITLEGAEAWPAGTTPMARVGYPDGSSEEVRLERVSDFEFEAVVPARQGGTYAVGVSVEIPEVGAVIMSTVASRTFAAEYLPGEPDFGLMASVATATGGRGEVTTAQTFDPEGLTPGLRPFKLGWLMILLAALLWPVDVALRMLNVRRGERESRWRREGGSPPTPRPQEV